MELLLRCTPNPTVCSGRVTRPAAFARAFVPGHTTLTSYETDRRANRGTSHRGSLDSNLLAVDVRQQWRLSGQSVLRGGTQIGARFDAGKRGALK